MVIAPARCRRGGRVAGRNAGCRESVGEGGRSRMQPTEARAVALSDRGELRASLFRVHQESERIQ
jgi:hypothetical protein